jgi:hypothetical protein
MAVPAGGEIAIYDAPAEAQLRAAVGLLRPMWTAEVLDTFASGSEPNGTYWSFQQLGGGISISGGDALIRHKGGPLYDWMISKPLWVPSDPAKPFKWELIFTFPQTAPIYSPLVVVGGIDNTLGDLDEPCVIWQQGSASSASSLDDAIDSSTDNNERIFSTGSYPYNAASDQASHTYLIEWDPAKAVNAEHLTVRRDAVKQKGIDNAARPVYVGFGWVWPTLKNASTGAVIEDLGSSIANVIQIHSVKTTQLGAQGYETRSWPGWTSANAGGTTIDTAAEKERWDEDGETWAKFAAAQITRASIGRYRNTAHDTLMLELVAPDVADPDTTPNRFQSDYFLNRPIVVDTRVLNAAGTATAWKRQIAARIKKVRTRVDRTGGHITLEARSIPTDKLDVYLSRGWRGEADAGAEAVDQSKTLDDIFEDLVTISNKIAGGVLGDTDVNILGAPIVPQDIGTGGGTLLSAMMALADRTAHDVWREYETSGVGQYGILRINAAETGTGTGGYSFHGSGSASANNYRSLQLIEDALAMPAMVHYRQNNPVYPASSMLNTHGLPLVSRFPAWPYPPDGRILHDSLGVARQASATALVVYRDFANNAVNGGLARLRWEAEATRGRAVAIEADGHDWPEPLDEIDVDDPDWTGLTTAESWVVDGVTIQWEGALAMLTARIDAYTADWTTALERALA